MFIESVAEEIGTIRKAIVRAKREIREKIKNENEKHDHLKNLAKILNVINKKEMDLNERTIVIDLFQAIRDSSDEDLAMDLLDTLDTMNL